MKFEIRSVIEFIGVTAVVVSLVFVGYELRLSRSSALTEASGNSVGNNLALNALLADHPIVWRKGCLDEALDAAEQVVFMQLVRAVNTRYFQAWRRNTIGVSTGDPDRWPTILAINVHQYPGFGKAWNDLETSTPSGLSIPDGGNEWSVEVNKFLAEVTHFPKITASDEFYCGV